MRTRFIPLAVVALIALTAFAPAPFLKSGRKGERSGDALAQLQGTWKIADKQRMGPNGQLTKYSTSQLIVIEKDGWRFSTVAAVKGGKGAAKAPKLTGISYKIVLDTSRRPTEFRLKRTTAAETEYMVGILQPKGDTVEILYCLGTLFRGKGDESMPRDFSSVPQGWYKMTLKRD